VIDQVGGRLHHAPGAATGAEAPALAAERHQVFVMAAVALDAQEAVFQQSALQVVLELPAYEHGQAAAGLLDLLHEAGVVLCNDGVKGRLFRAVAVVGGRCSKRRRSEHKS
jgi:hypothetical protein